MDKHQVLSADGLGTIKGYEAKIIVESGTQPHFCKARPVPYALQGQVNEELERLEREGIITPVQFADWAAPIVPVVKQDGKSLRICGDFKLTVNQASKLDRYPIPRIEDLFAKLAGGQSFTKLDMSQAYQQILLDDDSRSLVVINTQRGLYRYNRLPFGVSSAPGIFQRVMESLLGSIPGVVVYLDDILITGPSEQEHLDTLEAVLQKLQEAGIKLRNDKCVFLGSSVTYLGHQIDAEGLHPIAEKVEALHEFPSPQNVAALKSYLGLLSYYSHFLPNLSTTLAPLYLLLKDGVRWQWTSDQAAAFEESKKLLQKSSLLVHFDPTLKIILACDASAYGIGAVLSHRMPDGSEKPVGFASRTLTKAEQNYSQIDKEALACVFGVQKFRSYLYGHHFTLQTDHKPLLTLFNENKAIPPQASGRIQRWALTLASFEYSIVCRSTSQHANADALSRLPLPDTPVETPLSGELVLMVERLQTAPISATQIAQWTRRDPCLSRVLQHIRTGWPERPDHDLRPFWVRRLELSVHNGCVLLGDRVVVPPPGRELVLVDLHGGHPGVSRMKALARSLVWWPGMDLEIEQMVRLCHECQQERPSPPTAPLHPWSWPTRPWMRLHVDFAGPLEGRMFLVVMDAHSKWLEVVPMKIATAFNTIQHLRQLFAQFGIPESVVSDNGPQFVAEEFRKFCEMNGIRHIRVAAYHPSSNGLAERGVQIFKQGFRKTTSGTVHDRLARFLFHYRLTLHSTTGVSPAELLLGRRLRSRLDCLQPSIQQRVLEKQLRQKEDHDRHCRARSFDVGEEVFLRNFGQGERWLPGHIRAQTGPLSFEIQLQDGRTCNRHMDHIRKRGARSDQSAELADDEDIPRPLKEVTKDVTTTSPDTFDTPVTVRESDAQMVDSPTQELTSELTHGVEEPGRHYPSRARRPPDCLTY